MRNVIVLSLFIWLNAGGQTNGTIRLGTFDQNITVKSANAGNPGRKVIELLAEGNGKALHAAELKYSFSSKLTAARQNNKWILTLSGTPLQLGGDLFYKGFSIDEYLLPSAVQLIVRLSNAGRGQQTYEFTDIYIANGSPVPAEKVMNDSVTVLTRAEVLNARAVFTSASIQPLLQRADHINEYYSAALQMDNAYLLLQNTNPQNIDFFDTESRKLHDAQAVIGSIEACNYGAELNLQDYDPARLLNKISSAKALALSKRLEMDRMLATLHLALFDRGMFFMQSSDYERAEDYFSRSLSVNPSFAPSLLQLARIDYKKQEYRDAVAKCDEVLHRLHPDPETHAATERLLHDIYEMYLDKAAASLSQKKFGKAEEQYAEANVLCQKYSGLRCTEELFEGMRKARTGLFNGYIAEAKEQLQNGDLDKAEEMVANADHFFSQNRNDITVSNTSSEVLRNIKQKRFDNLYSAAQAAYANKDYEAAIASLDKAESLKKEYVLVAADKYSAFTKTAARSYIIMQLDRGNVHAASNQLAEARTNLENSRSVQLYYLSGEDKSITDKIAQLSSKITSQQCINAQNEFNALHASGKLAATQGKFVEASESYSKAKAIVEKNIDCTINTGTLSDDNSAILPAATYLKLITKSEEEMKKYDYRESFNHYAEAEKYYGQFDVARFKINHLQQKEYILTRASDGLLYYSGDHYRNMKDLEQSHAVYKKLISHKYDSKALKGSLYQLGFDLARRDRTSAPAGSWKAQVQRYTEGSKEWKSLEKGYKKGWKS